MARLFVLLVLMSLTPSAAGKVIHRKDVLKALQEDAARSANERRSEHVLEKQLVEYADEESENEDELNTHSRNKGTAISDDEPAAENPESEIQEDEDVNDHGGPEGDGGDGGGATTADATTEDVPAADAVNPGDVEKDSAAKIPKSDKNTLDKIIVLNTRVGADKALTEGDIAPDSASKDTTKRDAILDPSKKWPRVGNFILVPYITSGLNAAALSALQGAIDNIQRISCVRIIPRFNEAHFIRVLSGIGCWSHIGKRGGQQDLSLGPGCEYAYIATHEFYHALGFWHEQSRRDRDNYITIYWPNIQAGKQHNFNMYNAGQAGYYGHGYDPASIMHYGNYAFSRNGQKTIDWKFDHSRVLSGTQLTSTDIGQLNAVYACNRNCDAFGRTTDIRVNAYALRTQLLAGLRLLSGNTNADLSKRFWHFITQCQYRTYYATAAVYNAASGTANHAHTTDGVSYYYRAYGKNFVVYTRPSNWYTPSDATQLLALNQVIAANRDRGCNAQASRDRAWLIIRRYGGRFVLVVRGIYNVVGYHTIANTKHAFYRCSTSGETEFVYLAF